MCDKCANIDYPIGDSIWLPCGGPASRYQYRRPTWNDESNADVLDNVLKQLRKVREENALLKEQAAHQEPKNADYQSIA